MRVLLSVYDKTGLEDFARGLVELGHELIASGGTAAALERGRHPPRHGRVGDRGARDARRPGQDPPPPPARRHPGRPVQARAPGRPGAPRASSRSGWWCATCTRSASNPSIELIDVGGPDHGAGRGQELGPRRVGRRPGRLRRGARRAAPRRGAVRRPAPPPGRRRLRPHRRLRRRHRQLVRRAGDGDDLPGHPAPLAGEGPDRSATARTPTSGAPATARSASTAGGTTWSSTAAWPSPTSTSTTPTPPGGWPTSWPTWARPRRWSSSTPTRAGRPSPTTSLTAYDRAFECDPMSAFGGIVALTAPVTEAVAAEMVGNAQGRRAHRPLLRRRRPRAVRGQTQEHAGPGRSPARRRPAGTCARSAGAGWSRTPTCSPPAATSGGW